MHRVKNEIFFLQKRNKINYVCYVHETSSIKPSIYGESKRSIKVGRGVKNLCASVKILYNKTANLSRKRQSWHVIMMQARLANEFLQCANCWWNTRCDEFVLYKAGLSYLVGQTIFFFSHTEKFFNQAIAGMLRASRGLKNVVASPNLVLVGSRKTMH